jgi:alpha-galactosidase
MTRSLRTKTALRGGLAAVVIAALGSVGLSSSSSAVPAPRQAETAASITAAATVATPAAVPPAPNTLGPAGEAALKPYMGWSSYSMQVYAPTPGGWITAAQLKAQSDAMHRTLQPFGYKYINIDAGWNGGLDAYGRPVPSKTLYPQGLQDVIDHIHANGQKVGLYGIPGISDATLAANYPVFGHPECSTGDLAVKPHQPGDYWGFGHRIDMTNPCSQKYIQSIADQYAAWGVDFLKYDSVTPGSGKNDLSMDARDEVKGWSQALAKHKIWYELSWALDIKYADYWKQWSNGWRVDWDVECYCANEALTAWPNIARLFPRAADWWRHAGPGGWNDLDSLNVGNGTMDGLTKDERRTAATLWAVSAAPFYLGNDLTKLDPYGLELLTNPEVIAVNQAGRPAQPVSTKTNKQVWYSLNADSTYTVALFNLGVTEANMTVNWSDLGLTGSANVRDLWAKKNLGEFGTGYTAATVPPHGVRLFKVSPERKASVRVNDDDLRVSYTGDWKRNENREVAAVSEPLKVTVTDSGAAEKKTAEKATNAGVRTLELNNDDAQIVYTGSWSRSTGRGLGDYQDDVQFTEKNDDAFSLTFVGTGVDYVTEKHESQGDVDIYIDGEFKQTVSTHQAEGRGAQQVVYSISDLPNGTHTIRGVKKSGGYMLLDKLNVRQISLLNPDTAGFDKNPSAQADVSTEIARDPAELVGIANAGKALVNGTDYTVAGNVVTIKKQYLATQPVGTVALDISFRGDYHDDVHATTVNGAAIDFTFKGTAVEWLTALAPDQGEADVYLDGKLIRRVNLHSDTRVTARSAYAVSGLKDNPHTLRIVKVSGEVLRNDTIRYTIR